MKVHCLAVIVCAAACTAAIAAEPASTLAADDRAILARAATLAIDNLGRPDGFFGNPERRIPLPGKLERVHKALQSLGVGDREVGEKADALVLAINRAAETALPETRSVVAEAIAKMPPLDSTQLAAGGDDILTRQLRASMSDSLSAAVQPLVAKATSGVRLAEKYKEMAGKASALGLLDPRDAELDGYVTRQALERLFREMARQESALRTAK
jgi:Protein of unknown function (DUF4197)